MTSRSHCQGIRFLFGILALSIGALHSPDSLLAAETDSPPADPMLVVRLNVAKYWNGPEADSLKNISRAHPIVLTSFVLDLESVLGTGIDNIERAGVIAPEFDSLVMVLMTRKPVDRNKLLDKLAPHAAEVVVNERRYNAAAAVDSAVYFVDDRTLLRGSLSAMSHFLNLAYADRLLSKWLKPAETSAGKDDEPLLSVQLAPTVFRNAVPPAGDAAEIFRPLLAAQNWRLTMIASGKLRLAFRAEFANEEGAQRAVPALDQAIQGLSSYFAMAESSMPAFLESQKVNYPDAPTVAPLMTSAIHAARDGIKTARAKRTGSLVELDVDMATDQPVTTAVLLMTLAPRAAKGPK